MRSILRISEMECGRSVRRWHVFAISLFALGVGYAVFLNAFIPSFTR